MTEVLAARMDSVQGFGKLVFLDKSGERAQEYPINKNLVVLGRDKACDIVITRREVSRHHAQLAVDDSGAIWLSSLGREPVSVNGKPATDPVELFTGDQIEIFLEGRVKILCFEAEEETVKINKVGPTPRKPLGEANQNTNATPASVAAKPAPPSANRERRTPVTRGKAGAPPPPAPPLPPKGSLFPGAKAAGAAASKIPKPPPLPKPADLRNSAKQDAEQQGAPLQSKTEAPQNRAHTAAPTAPGTFLPSANELLALRAGLRKVGAVTEAEGTSSDQAASAAPATASKASNAKKRKSVRFNIPVKEPTSPEGVPTDATVALDFGSPASPDVIINVNADSTAAFSAWAMGGGSAGGGGGGRRSLGDTLTGGLPCIMEEAPEDLGGSPPPCMQVTPSREITPMLRRRSGRTSSVTCSSPDSVGRKRRSCSGSRNGTPASKGPPIAADPDIAAAAAEEAALDASLAAAQAIAVGSNLAQEEQTAATLVAAAATLLEGAAAAVHEEATQGLEEEAAAAEQREEQKPVLQADVTATATPPEIVAARAEAPAADSPATPWAPQIGAEAAAVAAALAASRSATPASLPRSPAVAHATPGRRGGGTPARRMSRLSLPAPAAQLDVNSPMAEQPGAAAGAPEATEVLPQQPSAAKTGTKAPINTPTDAAGMPSFAALDMEGVAQQLAGWKAQAETAAVVDSDKVKALMEELEAANMRAHAYEVKAKALEAQLAEATTVAARLQQANEELSARLEALEQQQMAAMPAPQDVTEDVAEAMQVNVAQAEAAATQDAAPMEEDQAQEPQHTQPAAAVIVSPVAATPAGALAMAADTASKAARRTAAKSPAAAAAATAAAGTPCTRGMTPAAVKITSRSAGKNTPTGDTPTVASAGPSAGEARQSGLEAVMQLPFEGLSQALSQGSLEWVEGLILPPCGSQDLGPAAAAAATAGNPSLAVNPSEKPATPQPAVMLHAPLLPQRSAAKQTPARSAAKPIAAPEEHLEADVQHVLEELLTVADLEAVVAEEEQEPASEEKGQEVSADPVAGKTLPSADVAVEHSFTTEDPAEKLEAAQPPVMADVVGNTEAVAAAAAAPEEGRRGSLKELLAEAAAQVAAAAPAAKPAEEESEEEEDRCHVCGEADEGDVLLLCDACDNACHLGCARPLLRRIPKGDWFCADCKPARSGRASKRKAQEADSAADTAEEPHQPLKTPRRSNAQPEPAVEDAKQAAVPEQPAAPEEARAQSGRSTRRSSVAAQPTAQEPAARPTRSRRTSLTAAAAVSEAQPSMAEEAEEAALASAARPRRRASIAQTPAAAAPVGGAAVPRTAASTRGVRRRSVLPAADAAPHQEEPEPAPAQRMGPAKRMALASLEGSMGPALGSLGVIQEADEEVGSDADEGESAPKTLPKQLPAPARAARGRKALQDKTNQRASPPAPRRTRAAAVGPVKKKAKTVSPSPATTRRSTRSRN